MRSRILAAFEKAEACDDEAERRRLMTFVLVGAGPTGVELAGAIAELARQALREEFRTIDLRTARVVLVQSGPLILPAFPKPLSLAALRSLTELGVEVMTHARVEAIDADGVRIGDKRIEARTVLWTAGVMASPAGKWLAAERAMPAHRRRPRQAASRPRRGGQATGHIRRQADPRAHRNTPHTRAVPLPRLRVDGDDRPQGRRGRPAIRQAQRQPRLVALGARACAFLVDLRSTAGRIARAEFFVPPHPDSSLRSESDLSPLGRGRYRTYDCLGCVLPPTILSQVPVGT